MTYEYTIHYGYTAAGVPGELTANDAVRGDLGSSDPVMASITAKKISFMKERFLQRMREVRTSDIILKWMEIRRKPIIDEYKTIERTEFFY